MRVAGQALALAIWMGGFIPLAPDSPAWGATPGVSGTPVPEASSIEAMQREREEIYQGYARLFVLGHLLSRALGVPGVMPNNIDLSFFAEQPLLADTGNVFIYRPSERGDIMWPLIVPTPPKEPVEVPPTETPTPVGYQGPEETPTPTSTPTPTPTEVLPPPLKLQIASLTQTGPLVMIDGLLLTVGDAIQNATITEIGKHHAKIEYYGVPFYVTKKGTVRPEEFDESEFLSE